MRSEMVEYGQGDLTVERLRELIARLPSQAVVVVSSGEGQRGEVSWHFVARYERKRREKRGRGEPRGPRESAANFKIGSVVTDRQGVSWRVVWDTSTSYYGWEMVSASPDSGSDQ